VFFTEAPLAAYRGGVPGIEATNPRSRGERRLDPRAPHSRAYLSWLDGRQAVRLKAIDRALGRPFEVIRRYRAAGNGVAMRMTPQEAKRVAAVPGVAHVVPNYQLELATDRSVEMIGTFGIWDGSATTNGVGTQGEGNIIGVIDTGVNLISPSFSDSPLDGYTFTNPLGPGVHVGWCDPGNPNFDPQWVCNEKLIGIWDFMDAISIENDGPVDGNGHGSHTASIAAGNHVDYNGDGIADLSGVAPHANLITYDACGSGCPFVALAAAVDQAILDGVDAINFSITGGTNPYHPGDIDAFFLNAVAAGIFVAASAGNAGPGGILNHLGPWVTTVAASTHDRSFYQNQLSLGSGGGGGSTDFVGMSRTLGYGPAPIVHAKNFDNGDPDPGLCEQEFPPGTWSGEIVVCDRGDGIVPRAMKGQNVLKGGAGGFVLANNVDGKLNVVDEAHVLPAIMLGTGEGALLRAALDSGSGHTATITPSEIVLAPGDEDKVASFSSRGPNLRLDVLKPDVDNVGVRVFAAWSQLQFSIPTPYEGLAYHSISGTSMSSPHTAGSAALLRSLYPDWTPAEIKSALMMTAKTSLGLRVFGGSANPFDMGAGRVDHSRAGRAGIILDETEADYRAADPAQGGDPKTLNLPSFTDSNCRGRCSWTRTLEGTAPTTMWWTVSVTGPAWMQFTVDPPGFNLAPGASQDLTVEVTVFDSTTPLDTWHFGEVLLTPDDSSIPEVRMPVSIVPTDFSFLVFEDSSVVDSLGNDNGAIDPGELFELPVDLRNIGTVAASGISGRLSSSTPGVTILDDEAEWPPILPLNTRASLSPNFLVQVDDTVPCESDISFDLELSYNAETFPLSFHRTVGDGQAPPQINPVSVDTPLAIPEGSQKGVSSSIAVSDAVDVADMSVSVDITHPNICELIVDLKLRGNSVRLHNGAGNCTANLVTTYPNLTAPSGPGAISDFFGKNAAGTWSLTVKDFLGNNITGTINSWSLALTGVPPTDCSTIPCTAVAAASAAPAAICEGVGGTVLVSGAGSLEFGSGCAGTLEYRIENNGVPLQDWSTDPDVLVSPSMTTSYAVKVRDAGTMAEDLAVVDVDVLANPAPLVIQNPPQQCLEIGTVTLDAGSGFSSYTWFDESGTQVIGTAQTLDGTCQVNPTVGLLVADTFGCSGGGMFAKNCVTCTPPEVSPPGTQVPLRMGVAAADTVEFELLSDASLVYHLYNAESIAALVAGDYTYKLCDLEHGNIGTWTPVDATTVHFTPSDPGHLFEGYWVVVAEHPQGFVSTFGAGSDGTPRPPDADGQGSLGTFGCP
jgi:subtilisin-like proprotein convertase family protein